MTTSLILITHKDAPPGCQVVRQEAEIYAKWVSWEVDSDLA